MPAETRKVRELLSPEYKFGWSADIEAESAPRGLSEEIVRRHLTV